MPSKNYTTEEKVEGFLNVNIQDGKADEAMFAATDLVDGQTDRNFEADVVATARQYDGNGSSNLRIDECVDITKVERGADPYGDTKEEVDPASPSATTGYYTLPGNAASKGFPFDKLRLRNLLWFTGFQNHQVTAKWGYSVAPPKAITLATTILAAGIYQYNRGGSSGNSKSEKIGDFSVTYANDEGWTAYERAKLTINQYERYSL